MKPCFRLIFDLNAAFTSVHARAAKEINNLIPFIGNSGGISGFPMDQSTCKSVLSRRISVEGLVSGVVGFSIADVPDFKTISWC